MLVAAKAYEAELTKKVASIALDPYYKFWHSSYPDTEAKVDDSFWTNIQCVSVHNGEVIGYLKAHIDRPGNYVSSLSCVHFPDREPTKMVFGMDLRRFMRYLLDDLGMPKISWTVYRGNPVEKHYDRLIKKMGGRIVGIEKYAVKLGKEWYDSKQYEFINDYFECTHCGTKVKKEAEVMCWKCGLGEMVYVNPFNKH